MWFRYSELRLTNQKLTRQVGEKDEQLQETRQKVDSISLDLRKSDKAKREVISITFFVFNNICFFRTAVVYLLLVSSQNNIA